MAPFGVEGSDAYVVSAGLALEGFTIRESALLFSPPKQTEAKNRSPLNGSTASGPGQGRPLVRTFTTAPVFGSICTTFPVLAPPPVAPCVAYRLPSLPKTGWPIVCPMLAKEL